jgi:hypothetical protein
VAPVRPEEDILTAAAMLLGAGTPPTGMGLDLAVNQAGEEFGQVDRQVRHLGLR